MKLTTLLAFLFTVAFAKPGWNDLITSERGVGGLLKRCTPLVIQRDVLCGCFIGKEYSLMARGAVRRCMATFRTGMKKMKESCAIYRRNDRVRTRRLINNLSFIHEKCSPLMAEGNIPVQGRMLTQEEIVAILEEIQDMILQILRALNMPGASIDPGSRMIMTGTNVKTVKVARLVSYNNIRA